MVTRVVALALLLLCVNQLFSQNCTNLGQTPGTAFPVCGESVFEQKDVPICGVRPIKVPGCDDGAGYSDKNPYWYKFTCFASGTLGFVITPMNLSDDYDWMLYDITGKSPEDVFTDVSLVVTGSWSGSSGTTGTSASGVKFIQCSSDPAQNRPTFAAMPALIVGHTYLLLVSHYTDSQSGYKLSFGGGTAVITDPKLPKLSKAVPGCGGVSVTVVLNKKMKCGSLAANGSDFSISPALAPIVAVSGNSCSSGFDMDTVVLTMGNALPPGNYTLTINKGADANTLLDNCDRDIPAGDNLPFSITAILPTPLDSVRPVGCAPTTIDLVFGKRIQCSAVAANGSDFTLIGPAPVTITGAQGLNCSNGLSAVIRLQLSAPIQQGGTYTIQLRPGIDGNTIIDECGQETPPSTITFPASDTVNALFNHQVFLTCTFDTVAVSHPGGNGVNEWHWNFNGEGGSDQQSFAFGFPTFGTKKIQLAVSNGVCMDTAQVTVELDNELRAGFMFPAVLCPEDPAVFKDSSFGKIINWSWDFGNTNTSTGQEPAPQRYKRPLTKTGYYNVRLIVENDLHFFDTVTHRMEIVYSCYITVPNAFTPNGDGNNDYLYPLNAWKAQRLEFQIYNRYGQQVFFTTNWQKKWDGNLNGIPQPSGAYVWKLSYIDGDTQERKFQKGVTNLIR